MGIRTDPANPNLHYIDCRPDGYKGKRVREEFTGTREEAEEYYRALMQRPLNKPLPQARTLNAMWPEYLQWCEANWSPNTVKDFRNCWARNLQDYFGSLRPKMLTKALIETYKQQRLTQPRWGKPGMGTVSRRTITKEVRYIAWFVSWAVDNDYCAPLSFKIQGFPAKLTRPPKPRPLTPEQVSALLAQLSPELHLCVLLMTDAGLRASEALCLRRDQVQLERSVLYVLGKGAKERIVPIATTRLKMELERAMAKADAGSSGYLTLNPRTGKPYGSLKKSLAAAAKRAGIEQHVYQHLLRHTFGTLATFAGVAQAALQDIMGHSSPVTTGIYQTLAAEQLRQQTINFGAMMDGATCPDGQVDNTK